MKNVIIFDGENDIEVSLKMFFTEPVIWDMKPADIVAVYQSTAVFHSVLFEMKDMIDVGIVKNVNDKPINKDYVAQVEKGLDLLTTLIMDTFGEEAGDQIIQQAKEAIANESV